MPDTSIHIERIPANRRLEAARLMAGPKADRDSGARFLAATTRHGVELDEFWGLSDTPDGPLRAAALLTPAAGGAVMAFVSPFGADVAVEDVGQLLDAAATANRAGSLMQALLESQEDRAADAFLGAGFTHVGDLLYMRRPWSAPGGVSSDWPPSVEVEPWRDGLEDELAAALERSYIDTLDCPELCGLRQTPDVVASHKATGKFDPHLWWLVRFRGAPAGALLLNPCPTQGHTELVYLGLGPELRGSGMGRSLVRFGLKALSKRRHRTVLCAVDSRNAPAKRLYEREGFSSFAQRRAFVRAVTR